MNDDALLENVSHITHLAQTMVEAHHWPPLRVVVLWYPDIHVDLLTQELAQTLAAFVEPYLATLPADGYTLSMDNLRSSPLCPFVCSLTILRLSDQPSQWVAGIAVPSMKLSPPPPDIPQAVPTSTTSTSPSIETANDQAVKRVVMINQIVTFLPQAQKNAFYQRLMVLRRSGQDEIIAAELLNILSEYVPEERREEMQTVLAAMQEDAEQLSLEAFIEKWAVGDDSDR